MAYSITQIKQLKLLYKQLYATNDHEEKQRINSKIIEIKTGKKASAVAPEDRLSWKRELSKTDEEKKKQGIDAHSFYLERIKK